MRTRRVIFCPKSAWREAVLIPPKPLYAKPSLPLADQIAKLEANGLEMCCVATSVRMADPDRAAREKHIEDLHTYIDLAADLGSTKVRTFGGPQAGRKGELHAAVEYAVEGYAQCVDHAAERGVTILMETHDDWSNSASVRAVVERLNHPNLKVLW